jgi:hypothetical protein
VSLGAALSRAAFGAVVRAAREIQTHGTFSFADEAIPFAEISALVAEPSRPGA